jgi:hypothetical protein
MIVKETGQNYSVLNRFSFLGKNKVTLSKGFVYVLRREREAMFSLLIYIEIQLKKIDS